jgi:hypothetical protein
MEELRQNLEKVLGKVFLDGIRSMVEVALPSIAPTITPKLALGQFQVSEHMGKWSSAMSDTVSVQYGKAFARLAGRPITIRDVVAYRDMENVVKSGIAQKALKTKFTMKDVDTSDSDAIWDAVETVTKAADMFALLEETTSRPSREDIAREITEHKKRKKKPAAPAGVTMDEARSHGVIECVEEFCKACGYTKPTFDAHAATACDQATSTDAGGGETFGDHATNGNLTKFASCPFPSEWNIPTEYDPEFEDAWSDLAKGIAKSYHLHKMQSSIPQNMMAEIEKQAIQMASGMENGTMDLSQMNIGAIGESVLKQCSTSDLDQLAGNLHTILPNINTLASSLKESAGGDLPVDVNTLLAGASAIGK